MLCQCLFLNKQVVYIDCRILKLGVKSRIIRKHIMDESQRIVWKIEGKIINHDGFMKVLADLVAQARKEEGTLTYWWSIDKSGQWYTDLDCYADEAAALAHLDGWAQYADVFTKHASIERCIVYGDVPDSIKKRLEGLSPCYYNYYGGFSKLAPEDSQGDQNDIIWIFEGHITDTERFHESMELLTSHTVVEEGSLMHWWSVKPLCDGMGKHESERRFHIIERYANEAAAMKHLDIWNTYGCIFMQSTVIEAFHVHSSLSPELAQSIEAFYPIQMNWIAGFTR